MKSIIFKVGMLFVLVISSCVSKTNDEKTSNTQYTKLGQKESLQIQNLMAEFKVKGVGLGIIKKGVLVNTGYYGEQSPNLPISKNTMFNVASTTKAVMAELFLRLAAKGEVDLDEPISKYYVYADIIDDSRHKLLTPRIILSHKTGFRNWPWEYEDKKLAFDNDPGEEFGYSGIGFYILAKFLEEKLWVSFPHLVQEIIFNPLEMKNTSIVRESWFEEFCPTPVDKEGNFISPYNHPIGYWNPADDLHVTVEDYAKFLISSMNNEGLTNELIRERETIYSELSKDAIYGIDNDTLGKYSYPPTFGYGIGWMVFDYGDGNKNIQHGGNDEGEASMAYFHSKTKNGLIVFCNGGNAVLMLPKIVELLDSEQKYTPVYNNLFDKFFYNINESE